MSEPVRTEKGRRPTVVLHPSWRLSARCSDGDADDFYAPDEQISATATREREQRAKQICARCPVLMSCRAEAILTLEPYGIWGGLSEADRRRLKRPYGFGSNIKLPRTSVSRR